MPLTLAVVVQPCTEHVHVHARGVSDISSGHARTRAKVGRVLVFYSFYEENQAELKQPERLETRGWLVGGSRVRAMPRVKMSRLSLQASSCATTRDCADVVRLAPHWYHIIALDHGSGAEAKVAMHTCSRDCSSKIV